VLNRKTRSDSKSLTIIILSSTSTTTIGPVHFFLSRGRQALLHRLFMFDPLNMVRYYSTRKLFGFRSQLRSFPFVQQQGLPFDRAVSVSQCSSEEISGLQGRHVGIRARFSGKRAEVGRDIAP
jgi:hypothetical protein